MSFEFSQNPQAIWLYQYDADGVYIGSVFMTIPAGTGLPANTTHVPCQPEKGQTGIFKNGEWEYLTDIRGTPYWNIYGNGFVISSLSESLPEWAITAEPPAAEDGYVLFFADGQWTQIEIRPVSFITTTTVLRMLCLIPGLYYQRNAPLPPHQKAKPHSLPDGTGRNGCTSKTCAVRLSGIPRHARR
ncbi:hypothetical protein [Klebsiella pneumoniae]|uniref:hypothetical protein n=1 Tax=Klebsiella pneumoniae TaxID=573 RepID=UPI00203065BA|nr:hypothetical protein [Klebsiella pneumoniae]URU47087.1 hypothetical protein NBY30_25495 [Klebsiella pneumoniae]